jgi:hypothetical protein
VLLAVTLPAAASTVLFIGDRDDSPAAGRLRGDNAMIAALQWWGNTVIARDDEGSGSGGGNGATGADLAAADFVIISASASSGNVKGNDLGCNDVDLLNANKTIINMEPGLADEFFVSPQGGGNFAVYDSISTINPPHQLLTGIPAPASVQITNGVQDMVWQGTYASDPILIPILGVPFDNYGTVLATVDGAAIGFAGIPLAMLSEVDHGDGTIIKTLPFGEDSFDNRTMKGQRLFANAIEQAGGIPEPTTCTMLIGLALMGLLWLRRRAT